MSSEIPPLNRNDRLITWALLFVPFAYFMLYFDAGLNWMDEGALLGVVECILRGGMPYRDAYQIYPPGRYYLFAGLFSAFGPYFLITRIVWAIGHAVLGAWIFRLARRGMSASWALIPAIAVTLAPGPWQKTPYLLGTVAAIWLAVWYDALPTVKRAAIVGLGAAIIFVFRQEVGAFAAALGGIFVLVKGRNKPVSVLALAGAFILPTAMWVAWFFAKNAGWEMVNQVAFAGAKGFHANPLPFPRILDPLEGVGAFNKFLAALGRAAFYAPLLIAGFYLRLLYRNREKLHGPRGALYAAVLASTLPAFNIIRARSDFAHLWQAYPVVDLMVAVIVAIIGSKNRRAGIIVAAVFLAIVGGAAFSSNDLYHGGARVLQGRTVRLDNPKAPVRLTPAEKEVYTQVQEGIEKYTSPGEHIFLAPDIPLFYYLTGRPSATPWTVVRPSFLWGERDQVKVIKLLESTGTRLVVIRDPEVIPPTEKRIGESYPLLYEYILKNYNLVETRGDFKFYLKRQEI